MADAILFNGAASLIAQEAGVLDLLLGNVDGVSGVLDASNVKFVGGLSSGALMTFTFNAAFSQNSKLTWDQFKNEVLFTLTTEKVYTTFLGTRNTEPLRQLLQDLTDKVGLHQIKDLPFESTILTTYAYPSSSEFGKYDNKTIWLTNIEKVTSILPSETDKFVVAKQIKEHQLDITLVSSLMSSTAIPLIFPAQHLIYNDSSNQERKITNKYGAAAYFVDGGTGDGLVFSDFHEFFDAYNEKFDNIYFISPDYTNLAELVVQRLSSVKSSDILEQKASGVDSFALMNKLTKEFIKQIRDYNSDGHLANKIYYCKPSVVGFDVLDFGYGKEQYDQTITWGKNYPNKIAIDITTIPDSELEREEA